MTDIHAVAGFAEPISSWTHLGGAGAFLYLIVRRLRALEEPPAKLAAVMVFGFATVLQLGLSGVYHLLDLPSVARPVLQQLDHAAIFVLIAGTLTAVHGILFTGAWRSRMITIAWVLCAVGISLKMVFFTETDEWLGLACYFAMGLLGFATTVALWTQHGAAFAWPMLAGGIVYTIGALMDFLREPVIIPGVFGPHECLHVAVLIALTLHWRFILRVLDQQSRAEGDLQRDRGASSS